ncbi:phosphotransferase family protein [Erysipelothrix sp. HDW6A]|uniref:choline/ethanolamine kinase family protein n=1 Tax=Erysipelothrix sp. HDW6A TaxID=2714928 RepID=UPI00140C9DA6|nr:choline/ethanolamine kinase family protein [Erysipelothrix sp. HDW6A]QIK57361.1 phosphotransferase family protein [Erysipelothrix sp. HDW6A]
MKRKERLQQILNKEIICYRKIETGLTNDNYYVETADGECVVRCPKPENQVFFDYKHEAKVIQLLEPYKLDVPVYFYNENTGLKVTQYIHDVHTFELPYIEDAADLIKRLHHATIQSGKRYNIKEQYEQYHEHITKFIHDLSPYEHYIDDVVSVSSNWCLCHNDLVEGNFLFGSEGNYLIDYEYACDNDPCFDVMSFLTENNIMDTPNRNRFYKSYYGFIPEGKLLKKLDIFENGLNVLWCAWAQMMYSKYEESIYKEIADIKYSYLK